MFQSKYTVRAIEFSDLSTVQEIIQLTGARISLNFSSTGDVQSAVLKDGTNEIVAVPGQFIYKNNAGNIGVCSYEYLTENYEEITDQTP